MKSKFLPEYLKNKKLLMVFLIMVTMMTVISCKQSSIFYQISNEVKPKKSIIPGAPSKIVAMTASSNANLNNKLYLARKAVWFYDGNRWAKMVKQPPATGEIVDIAAANDTLFALAVYPFELWKTSDGEQWIQIENASSSSYPFIQAIYAVDDQLFAAGAIWNRETASNQNYALLWYDGSELVSLKENMGDTGRLTGALHIGSDYYLATLGGIYSLNAPAAGALSSASPLNGSTENGYITGIIADIPQENLLAVSADGGILTAPAGASQSFTEKNDYSNVRFNGALNIMETSSGNYVLMIGYASQSDTFDFGYREIVLSSGNFADTGYGRLEIPGDSAVSSIVQESNDEYESSLRREIVSSIIQTPGVIDPNRTLFASTYRKGLWSYRNGEWNAED